MKKYKHKKTGIIAVKDGASYKLEAGNMIPSFIFEDTNDWEKVIEKDYEILSFKQNSEIEDLWEVVDTLCEKFARKSGQMFCTTPYTLEEILNNPLYSIYSIKRLSDGEIFTVGDVDNFGKITAFDIQCNTIVSMYYRKGDWQWLSSIKHLKNPLFTTEDGVDIFEGDEYWKVLPNSNYGLHHLTCVDSDLQPSWTFSTKEAAEEYVLMNKPCLSINDVSDTLNINKYGSWYKNLKKLVKSKL